MVNSDRKGKKREREVCAEFRRRGFGARRNPHQAAVGDGRDLEVWVPCGGHPDTQARKPCDQCRPVNLCVQVKSGKAPSPWKAFGEARGSAEDGEVPWGVLRRDGDQWLVVMPLAEALVMARVVQEALR